MRRDGRGRRDRDHAVLLAIVDRGLDVMESNERGGASPDRLDDSGETTRMASDFGVEGIRSSTLRPQRHLLTQWSEDVQILRGMRVVQSQIVLSAK